MPSPELRAAVETLMDVLQEHRDEFNTLARADTLRRSYERFRCECQIAGFRVSVTDWLARRSDSR